MEWLVGIAVVGVLWWFGRDRGPTGTMPSRPVPGGRPVTRPGPPARHAAAAVAPLPVADQLLRRAVDPDDPDGAFMDGYVAGRLTERYLEQPDAARPTGPWQEPPRAPVTDDEDDPYGFDSGADPDGDPDDW